MAFLQWYSFWGWWVCLSYLIIIGVLVQRCRPTLLSRGRRGSR